MRIAGRLAIVSQVRLPQRGDKPQREGVELEFIFPWNIREWELRPKADEVV